MQKLMATFQPSVDFAKDKYGKAHDAVVVNFDTASYQGWKAFILDKLQGCMLPRQ